MGRCSSHLIRRALHSAHPMRLRVCARRCRTLAGFPSFGVMVSAAFSAIGGIVLRGEENERDIIQFFERSALTRIVDRWKYVVF